MWDIWYCQPGLRHAWTKLESENSKKLLFKCDKNSLGQDYIDENLKFEIYSTIRYCDCFLVYEYLNFQNFCISVWEKSRFAEHRHPLVADCPFSRGSLFGRGSKFWDCPINQGPSNRDSSVKGMFLRLQQKMYLLLQSKRFCQIFFYYF